MKLADGIFGREQRMIQLAVAPRDDTHVVLCLVVGRDTVVLINSAFASVVTCERERDVAVESLQKKAQITRSRLDVRRRVVDILTTEATRSRRNHLHQPLCSGARASLN